MIHANSEFWAPLLDDVLSPLERTELHTLDVHLDKGHRFAKELIIEGIDMDCQIAILRDLATRLLRRERKDSLLVRDTFLSADILRDITRHKLRIVRRVRLVGIDGLVVP